jgi:hypothetical protein
MTAEVIFRALPMGFMRASYLRQPVVSPAVPSHFTTYQYF